MCIDQCRCIGVTKDSGRTARLRIMRLRRNAEILRRTLRTSASQASQLAMAEQRPATEPRPAPEVNGTPAPEAAGVATAASVEEPHRYQTQEPQRNVPCGACLSGLIDISVSAALLMRTTRELQAKLCALQNETRACIREVIRDRSNSGPITAPSPQVDQIITE